MGRYIHPLTFGFLVHSFNHIFVLEFCLTIIYDSLTLQPGKYVWLTYKEVYDLVIKVGNSIRSCGVEEVSEYLLVNYWHKGLKFVCLKVNYHELSLN